MDKKLTEMYVRDGGCPGAKDTKYVLCIYDDHSIKLTYYNGMMKCEEPIAQILPVGNNGGKCLEFGSVFVKTSFPFRKYIDGTLDERWTQIL